MDDLSESDIRYHVSEAKAREKGRGDCMVNKHDFQDSEKINALPTE